MDKLPPQRLTNDGTTPTNESRWRSAPSFFSEFNAIHIAAGCFLIGLLILFVSCYVIGTEILFLHRAQAFDATIVDVRRETVAAGRGSVVAYVPVVEMPNTGERLVVDTSSEENIFSEGGRIEVLCDLSLSRKCIRDRFVDKWWGLVDLALALFLLIPSFLYIRMGGKGAKRRTTD